MKCKERLEKQITDAAGNVQYTFVAHWKIVKKLKMRYDVIKIVQIILTAVSTGGFFVSIVAGVPCLSWIGGITSSIALGLNLYMLHFNLPDLIKAHMDAANCLWEVRENYKSLLTDFDDMELDKIREARNELMKRVNQINRQYPGTDDKSFKEAQSDMDKYKFVDGEAANLLHIGKR